MSTAVSVSVYPGSRSRLKPLTKGRIRGGKASNFTEVGDSIQRVRERLLSDWGCFDSSQTEADTVNRLPASQPQPFRVGTPRAPLREAAAMGGHSGFGYM